MNNTIPTNAPPIAPIPAGAARPLWSVMVPAFNCAKYLATTLESVLQQDPGPEQMQIEVIDDCSTKDNPREVVERIGKGRVGFYQKSQNEGVVANFNSCIGRSRGHLVHILHGDDFVCPGFYAAVGEVARQYPEVSLVASRSFFIDEEGVIMGVTQRLKALESPSSDVSAFFYNAPIQTPGVVVRRDFYEAQGGFLPSLVHTADWEMWSRAIDRSGGVVLKQPLACYRVFAQNDSGRLSRAGENLRDTLRLVQHFKRNFDGFQSEIVERIVAETARSQAERYQAKGDTEAYQANIKIWNDLATLKMKLRRRGGQFLRMAGLR
jgi:glycosyltransferase involved in cell wall biosynthesis